MDLTLSADQSAILDALDQLTRRWAAPSLHDAGLVLEDADLDSGLSQSGFLDVGFDPDLGPLAAALVTERLARLAPAVEAGASALVRPLLGLDWPRPVCLVRAVDRRGRPVRFLRPGASVVVLDATDVRAFVASDSQVEACPSALFAYPVARLVADARDTGERLGDVDPASFATRWRIALAAEGAGLLAAALDSTVSHVSERRQFGRPLASFQALRHRLADIQVRALTAYWLAMKAAATLDPGDAALAALHVQDMIGSATYDFHQFLGAMGITLEHPLHCWTYRLKLLASELGGSAEQGKAAAAALWAGADMRA